MLTSFTNSSRCGRALADRRSIPLAKVSAVAAVTLACGGAFASNELLVPTQFPTIQAAVDAAQSGDTVVIAAGVFSGPGNQNINPQNKGITIRGTKAASGLLLTSIQPAGGARGFRIENGSPNLVIEQLRVVGAAVTDAGSQSGWDGAGALVLNSSPTFRACSFEGNQGWGFGGAISFTDCTATVEGCNFLGNTSVGGGAIAQFDSFITYRGCSFKDNATPSTCVGGGAIVAYTWNQDAARDGSVTVERCIFDGNMSGTIGGAIATFQNIALTIDRCMFRRNSAASGFVIGTWLTGEQPAVVTNSVFADNGDPDWAFGQGAIWQATMSDVRVVNCTIVGNRSDWHAGGLFHDQGQGTFRIENSIAWNNGSLLLSLDTVGSQVTNSIVDAGGVGGPLNGSGNLVSNVSHDDPMFAAWSQEGLELSPGSPAVDAGDTALLIEAITFDFAGNPRVRDIATVPGTGVDLGAFELTPACPADYDASGFLDTDDYDVFASVFESGDPAADFDSTGFVDTDDFDAFVQAFEAGC